MVDAVLWDEQEAEAKYETDLTEFDEDMKNMLDVNTKSLHALCAHVYKSNLKIFVYIILCLIQILI